MAYSRFSKKVIFDNGKYEVYEEIPKAKGSNGYRVLIQFGGGHLIVNVTIDITDLFLFLSKNTKGYK